MESYCLNSKLLLGIKSQRLLLTALVDDLSQEVQKERSEFGTSQTDNDWVLASTTTRIQILIMTTERIIMRNFISLRSITKRIRKMKSKTEQLLIKMKTKILLLQEKLR